ncbi:methyltransferase-like 26 [Topomyia yanbarensis]|uniref:methyltransferase-like 26 n=1 Tax=Topomyia yanbarensis TaxID=2498891 RepID=UPI00273B81AD|nr:methyltransferase-like 26 [Topomyia yanbarensis]XP_058820065.1 methyltransferase-like 26 [Topomyia yanbarensis]XP_058820066.1 methyltransferase-like 26 [Topomyia yanbarensis]XP_058820067.1 methyltransferase-like 26 [Topomyia yanbarensis]XP_058820068.1 methyltransferase-like 26 [Topomyia yanbarensis]XP_058820069.1 methyltransferase-like 26 [Topomyia yanbarensis]
MISHIRKLSNPAGERNKRPILEVLNKYLDKSQPGKKLLEISSGVGLHAAFFAPHFPSIRFQPSEYDTSLFGSIEAYRHEANVPNLQSPIAIDISRPCTEWNNDHQINFATSAESFDYILNINMIHISPIECSQGLFWNASRLLKKGGLLITYGPYAVNGTLTPESNVQFDASLRSRNPAWGVRDTTALEKLSTANGIALKQSFDLPSNNKCLIWEKINELKDI